MSAIYARINTILLLLVLLTGLAILAMLAGRALGGPLDPPQPPASTLRPLDELDGAWSRKLAANDGAAGPNPPAGCNSSRFTCVMDDQAVLDRETGLVWWRQADAATTANWYQADAVCADTGRSGRLGWRLPTLHELGSLVDYSVSDPALPTGHPFNFVQSERYWTSTGSSGVPDNAFTVDFVSEFGYEISAQAKLTQYRVWCVRG